MTNGLLADFGLAIVGLIEECEFLIDDSISDCRIGKLAFANRQRIRQLPIGIRESIWQLPIENLAMNLTSPTRSVIVRDSIASCVPEPMRCTIVVALVAALGATGCATPPHAEVDAAREEMRKAKSIFAGDYAAEAMRVALDAEARLEDELKGQEARFGLMRSYADVSRLSMELEIAAEKAQHAALVGKEKARREAADAAVAARETVNEAKVLLRQVPRGPGLSLDLEAVHRDLAGAEASLDELDTVMASERFKDAKTRAGAVETVAASMKAALEGAIAAQLVAAQAAETQGRGRRP